MRITTSQIIVSLTAICAGLVGLSYKLHADAENERIANIIEQSAICANNVPGEGFERKGAYLVGWLNPIVSGRHRIDVPGAERVVMGRDITNKDDASDSVTIELTQGVPVKFIAQYQSDAPFKPRWTMPNGLEWEIPQWAMYSLSRAAVRTANLAAPQLIQKAKP